MLRTDQTNMARFRRNIAGLAVAALMWSSGQGIALSTVFQLLGTDTAGLWHCVMMPGSDMPLSDGGHRKSEVPADPDHGFCPACSLTGCGSAAVTLVGELNGFTARQFDTGVVFLAAQPLRIATSHHRPPARAPPVLV